MKSFCLFMFLFFSHGLFAQSQNQVTRERCGTPSRAFRDIGIQREASDCTSSFTNPTAAYDPGNTYEITVVFHVIMHSSGAGAISDNLIHSQIEVLNEDFLALTGTNGEGGTQAGIRFRLATEDPSGNPTTGITRTTNDNWFDDTGNYQASLAWDGHRYLNVFTNSASGNLGYVEIFPSDEGGKYVGSVRENLADGVVLLWDSLGRDAPIGPPYDQGRTLTHEIGHYLGLEHTFNPEEVCGSSDSPDCYSDGDLICDTNPELNPNDSSCTGEEMSCDVLRPIRNYMNYSDDLCMNQFTQEQVRRMRCMLESYRSNLFTSQSDPCTDSPLSVTTARDQAFCLGDSIQLEASVSGGQGPYTYAWTPSQGLDSTNSTIVNATPDETTTYQVVVTDSNNCEATAQVTLTLQSSGAILWASWLSNSSAQDTNGNGIVEIMDFVAGSGCVLD